MSGKNEILIQVRDLQKHFASGECVEEIDRLAKENVISKQFLT